MKRKNILLLFIISFVVGFLDAIALPLLVRKIFIVSVIGSLETCVISLLAFYFLPKAFELEFSEFFVSFTKKYKKYRCILAALYLSCIYCIFSVLIPSIIHVFFSGIFAFLLMALSILLTIPVITLAIRKIFSVSVKSSIYIILLTIVADFITALIPLISIWIKYRIGF